MVYEYINDDTREIIEKEFSMKEEIPQTIKMNDRMYYRNYNSSAIHIPFGWGDTRNRPKYGQSPSGKKHFW